MRSAIKTGIWGTMADAGAGFSANGRVQPGDLLA